MMVVDLFVVKIPLFIIFPTLENFIVEQDCQGDNLVGGRIDDLLKGADRFV